MRDRSEWVKAEKSGPDSNCVEMRRLTAVEVRDTKQRGLGPTLAVSPAAFDVWLSAARGGELDHLA